MEYTEQAFVHSREEIVRFLDTSIQGELTEMEKQELYKTVAAWALNQVVEGKPLGEELFRAVAKHSYSISFEGILLRTTPHGEFELFLTRRSKADPVAKWRGMLHVPGIIVQPGEVVGDQDLSKVVHRLSYKEYGGLIISWSPIGEFWGIGVRGSFLTKMFLISCSQDPAILGLGEWQNTSQLSDEVITYHKEKVIPHALLAFKQMPV